MIPTLGELIGLDRPSRPGEVGPEARALEQEIAQLRADIRAQGGGSERRGAAGEERGGPGIALVFPGATDLASTRAYSVMGPVAGEYPLQAVNPQSFRRALDAAGCGAEALTECGRDVAAASGVRMVALIEGTEPRGGQLPLSVTLVDLDLGVEHPGYTIELPATDEGTAEESLAALADSVYLHAIERLRLAPVIHHVRPAGDGRWILDPRGRRYDAEARSHRPPRRPSPGAGWRGRGLDPRRTGGHPLGCRRDPQRATGARTRRRPGPTPRRPRAACSSLTLPGSPGMSRHPGNLPYAGVLTRP
ncbi:MAG: hypothetical protein U5L11_01890 [Arhodomonas sp.]|nr:hypothetical protein [Arhodomonas sp.]